MFNENSTLHKSIKTTAIQYNTAMYLHRTIEEYNKPYDFFVGKVHCLADNLSKNTSNNGIMPVRTFKS